MADYKTPGVYIEENNAFPYAAVAVETAVPVFIGYTEKATRKGVSLIGKPIRIGSFAEYVQCFGTQYHHKFHLRKSAVLSPAPITNVTADMVVKPADMFYFYNCMRLFYQNGGGNCYILSVGTYGEGAHKKTAVDAADLSDAVFTKLEKTPEPTLIVIPDFVNSRSDCYELYKKLLQHCQKMQSRFGIFDVIPGDKEEALEDTLRIFREGIGTEGLRYGAAYYPWLHTSVVPTEEVDFTNLAISIEDLKGLLPEKKVAEIIDGWTVAKNKAAAAIPEKETAEAAMLREEIQNKTLHQALCAESKTYVDILNEVRKQLNLLPPAAAMAGVYTIVDNARGVWKAPANISLSMVTAPAVNISDEEQQNMNVDAGTGKPVNAIRPFPGLGSLVWGARTLDGNSQDWRYINVRRAMIMIEQSLKLAFRAYVFEPNVTATWVTIKSMMYNFLNNLWKQGALAGATPEDAFDVQIGLGATMTPQDILDGNLVVSVKLALARPAEFIELTFQQKQQQS